MGGKAEGAHTLQKWGEGQKAEGAYTLHSYFQKWGGWGCPHSPLLFPKMGGWRCPHSPLLFPKMGGWRCPHSPLLFPKMGGMRVPILPTPISKNGGWGQKTVGTHTPSFLFPKRGRGQKAEDAHTPSLLFPKIWGGGKKLRALALHSYFQKWEQKAEGAHSHHCGGEYIFKIHFKFKNTINSLVSKLKRKENCTRILFTDGWFSSSEHRQIFKCNFSCIINNIIHVKFSLVIVLLFCCHIQDPSNYSVFIFYDDKFETSNLIIR